MKTHIEFEQVIANVKVATEQAVVASIARECTVGDLATLQIACEVASERLKREMRRLAGMDERGRRLRPQAHSVPGAEFWMGDD
jgi:hypothetical protein